MDTLQSMRTFRSVAELGSFAEASRRLNQSPAMTSKHVMNLEARVGVRLLNRNSRNVSLTDSGREYLSRLAETLDALDDAEAAISESGQKPAGLLRISAPVWIACAGFTHLLANFQQQYPEVRLDIDLSGRLVDLVDEGIDLALRVSDSPGDQYIARRVSEIRFEWVASPQYLKRCGYPSGLDELSQHRVLWYSGMPANINALEELQQPGLKQEIEPILISGNETLLYHAVLQHMGIAVLPHWLTSLDLQNQTLVRVFDDHPGYQRPLLAVYSSRKHLSSKIRVFIDYLATHSIV